MSLLPVVPAESPTSRGGSAPLGYSDGLTRRSVLNGAPAVANLPRTVHSSQSGGRRTVTRTRPRSSSPDSGDPTTVVAGTHE